MISRKFNSHTWMMGVLDGYLSDDDLAQETIELARKVWLDVLIASGWKMPAPAVMKHEDGFIMYCWDAGTHHLECQIDAFHDDGSPVEWFYRMRETEGYWGVDRLPEDPVPAAVVNVLSRFHKDPDLA